jgi:hypothetical protein
VHGISIAKAAGKFAQVCGSKILFISKSLAEVLDLFRHSRELS